MLLAAVSVLVLIATGDPADGSTRAIEQSLRAALVRDATVVVRPSDGSATDAELAAMGSAARATLLGVVSWSEKQRRVVIRFVTLPSGRWTDREVRFDSADIPTERGRTVGFALASMMPEDAFTDPAAPSPSPAPPPPLASSPSLARSPSPSAAEVRPPAALPRPNPLALDASGLAVAAPSGYGGGAGGVLALRVPIRSALGVRVAANVRAESIGPAQSSLRMIGGAVGLAWQPWLDPQHRWGVGVRADALLVHLDVAHLSEDDAQAAHLSRVMGGIDGALEGTFRFAEHAAVVSAVGTEVVFGRTDLFVHERQVTSLPPVKLMAELGLRVSFR